MPARGSQRSRDSEVSIGISHAITRDFRPSTTSQTTHHPWHTIEEWLSEAIWRSSQANPTKPFDTYKSCAKPSGSTLGHIGASAMVRASCKLVQAWRRKCPSLFTQFATVVMRTILIKINRLLQCARCLSRSGAKRRRSAEIRKCGSSFAIRWFLSAGAQSQKSLA